MCPVWLQASSLPKLTRAVWPSSGDVDVCVTDCVSRLVGDRFYGFKRVMPTLRTHREELEKLAPDAIGLIIGVGAVNVWQVADTAYRPERWKGVFDIGNRCRDSAY